MDHLAKFWLLGLLGLSEANEGAQLLDPTAGFRVSPFVLAGAFLLLVVVGYYIKNLLTAPKNLPPMVTGLPFLGCGYDFYRDPSKLLFDSWKKYGDIFSLYIFGERMTMLCDAEGIELFFKSDPDTFSAKEAYKFTIPVFGKNVVYDSPPDTLVEQKRFMKGGLTTQRFHSYVHTITEECDNFFKKTWGDGGTYELLTTFNELTVLTSTHCLQGIEVREKFTSEFSNLYSDLDAALSPIGFFFPNAPLPPMLRRNSARAKLGALFNKIIEERKKHPEQPHEDFLATLMEVRYKDGTPIPNEEIIGLLVGLLLAGQHTSNVTATWLGLFLLTHPEELKKTMEEQNRLMQGKDVLTFDELKEMNHLEHVMKETLRLRPPLIMLMRRVQKDVEFKGFTLPKGSLVSVSPLLIHRLPNFWTDSNKFDPERHAPPRCEDKNYRYAFMAFGAGRHKCSGELFAYLQVKTIWSYILRTYDIELVGGMPEPDYTTLIAGPKPPVLVKVTKKKV